MSISCKLVDNDRMHIYTDHLIRWCRTRLPAPFFSRLSAPAAMLLAVTLFSAALSAQETDSTTARLVAERPNASGTSTEVTISVYLIDIDEIDDVRQRYNVDLFVNIAWQDPRLALPEEEQSGQVRTLPRSEIWTPRGLVVNDRGLTAQLPLVVDVDVLGNVVYRQRLTGELAVDLDLKEFPFDTQQLPIQIISYQYSPDEIRFSPNSRTAANLEAFSVEGWNFRLLETKFGEFSVPALGVVRPQMTFIVEAT